ncbi:hypothetical protein WJX73_002432 [Symbiochloris irregularis]|uniref:CHCH domain-containing protein n=1 Tax=Symbiochloris irregularis TaxID=706552 RepID=A0AAW1PGI0_9CHLO
MGHQNFNRTDKVLESPCSDFYKASLRCLDTNGYDRSQCQKEFEDYKACKERESATRAQRRAEKNCT